MKSIRSLLLIFALQPGSFKSEVMPACDMTKSGDDICSDFCNYRCGFYNTSMGEDGSVRMVTLYRLTPSNVTGIRNKDTGDAPGDVTFYLGKKNLTQQCARDPTSMGCFLDGDNIYGKFQVEMSTQFGPYFECNPVAVGGAPWKPTWLDTQNFMCGQDCLTPTPDGCMSFKPQPHKNGTGDWGGFQCWCDGTARHNKTVGRELTPMSHDHGWGPKWWPPECSLTYYEAYDPKHNRSSRCARGKVLRKVSAWNFSSVAATACDACDRDDACSGWATDDNVTAVLYTGPMAPAWTEDCIGGIKIDSTARGWAGAGEVGGSWYSTPATAECSPGEAIGTNGCSWRVVSAIYKNASCIDSLIDAKIEVHGEPCFKTCQQPLNRTSDCYLLCYRNTLLGDPSFNITAMTDDDIVKPWTHGFEVDDPKLGGCPQVQPKHCEGDQCGPPMEDYLGKFWV